MDHCYCYPYFDPEFDPLSECITPLRVCIDNETCHDHTLVKVDSANRHGILLEMVQVLTDLDLIISKSYISSDGGWLMDVFHVTDHHGHKLIDPNLIHYIQQSLNFAQKQKGSPILTQVKTSLNNFVRTNHLNFDCSALEITVVDHPGLLSEVSTLLFELSCGMDSGEVWTHNGRAAFILNITEQSTGHPISDLTRLGYVEKRVRSVVEAHHFPGELWQVRMLGPTSHHIHIERRLHQLMQEDKDFEVVSPLSHVKDDHSSLGTVDMEAKRWFGCDGGGNGAVWGQYVSVESWNERDYLVVNVRSRNRQKLIFDTLCVLTDLEYDVFHASMSSDRSMEYYVRRMDGSTTDKEMERQSVVKCLVAALERRMHHGPKMELRTLYRHDLLSCVIRAFRENDLSINNAKFTKKGHWIVGTFYIINASSYVDDENIDQQRLEAVCNKIDRGIVFDKKNDCNYDEYDSCRGDWLTPSRKLNILRSTSRLFPWRWHIHFMLNSLGSILRSYIERISNNFGFVQS